MPTPQFRSPQLRRIRRTVPCTQVLGVAASVAATVLPQVAAHPATATAVATWVSYRHTAAVIATRRLLAGRRVDLDFHTVDNPLTGRAAGPARSRPASARTNTRTR